MRNISSNYEKTRFQIIAAVYLAVNAAFILPMMIYYLSPSVWQASSKNFFLAAEILYYLFGMTCVHLVLDTGFLTFSVRQFVNERKELMFAVSVLVVILGAAANVWFILHGQTFIF